jgi:hypothetical protein
MRTDRKLSRRSFLGAVIGGGIIGGGALHALSAGAAQTGGARASAPARGRGRNPITDGDKNPADVTGPRGCTDYDSGPRADPPTTGRGTGVNDQDRESGGPRARQYGDPTGCGRARTPRR